MKPEYHRALAFVLACDFMAWADAALVFGLGTNGFWDTTEPAFIFLAIPSIFLLFYSEVGEGADWMRVSFAFVAWSFSMSEIWQAGVGYMNLWNHYAFFVWVSSEPGGAYLGILGFLSIAGLCALRFGSSKNSDISTSSSVS